MSILSSFPNAIEATRRVRRGGSWGNNPEYLRAASRVRYVDVTRYDDIGFRVARTLLPLEP